MRADEYEAAVAVIVRAIEPHRGKLSTEACRSEQVDLVAKAILRGTVPLETAVEYAIDGDPFFDRALRLIAQECMAAGSVPEALARFVIYVLGASGPANFPKGQHHLNFWGRNSVVRMLVEETMRQWHIGATRNEATDQPAASTIVSDALRRCGIKVGEKQVGNIHRGLTE